MRPIDFYPHLSQFAGKAPFHILLSIKAKSVVDTVSATSLTLFDKFI